MPRWPRAPLARGRVLQETGEVLVVPMSAQAGVRVALDHERHLPALRAAVAGGAWPPAGSTRYGPTRR